MIVRMFTLLKWLSTSASPRSIIISSGWTFLLSPSQECSIYILSPCDNFDYHMRRIYARTVHFCLTFYFNDITIKTCILSLFFLSRLIRTFWNQIWTACAFPCAVWCCVIVHIRYDVVPKLSDVIPVLLFCYAEMTLILSDLCDDDKCTQ